jgi:Family of unknown function (DUF6152)
MSNATLVSAVGFALFLSTFPGHTHHSFSAEFDAEKPFKMAGTVTKVEWQNPHSWFYIDVKDESGNVTNWGMELASPNILMRNGWTRTSLNVGDAVTVEGFHARDGRNVGNARAIVLTATGKALLGGSGGRTP